MGYSSLIVLPTIAMGRRTAHRPMITVMLKMLDDIRDGNVGLALVRGDPADGQFWDRRTGSDNGQADDSGRQAEQRGKPDRTAQQRLTAADEQGHTQDD